MRHSGHLLLGSIGILALLGCSSSDAQYGPTSAYLVNAIAVADIDGNGLPDILGVVSRDVNGQPTQGYVSARLQNPDGSYVLPTRFGLGRAPASLVVADLNGDGSPDLVAANAGDQTVTVRLADPARPGFFFPAILLSTPGRTPMDVAVGDLNGDGKPDIVVAASGANNVMIFLQGSTTGTFLAPLLLPGGGDPQAVTVADLDGDGRPDIAVATTANTVSVWRQIQFSPTFVAQTAVDYPTGVQPVAIKAADVNGDGKLDLLTANYGAALSPGIQGLSVLLQGAAPGAFLAPVHYDTGYRATALATGDLNNDGKVDVVVTNSGLPGDPGSVSVLIQDAVTPGALLPAISYRGAWGPMGVAISDMDGDGRPDLVVADGDITVRFNRAAAPGSFDPPIFFYH